MQFNAIKINTSFYLRKSSQLRPAFINIDNIHIFVIIRKNKLNIMLLDGPASPL